LHSLSAVAMHNPSRTALFTPAPRCLPQGLDKRGVESVLEALRQQQQAHPGYLGGLGSPSCQLRQSTPPASLGAEAAQAIRRASVRLFGDLGLRDYAQFSGWVLPARAEAEGEDAEGEQQEQQQQQQQHSPGVLEQQQAEQQRAQQRPQDEQQQQQQGQQQEQQAQRRAKTFGELQAIDAAARAEAAAAAPKPAVSAADRAGVTDTTAGTASGSGPTDSAANEDAGQQLAVSEAGGQLQGPADYGHYNGIRIDDSYRPTADEVLAAGPYGRPIPDEPSLPAVAELEDLSGEDAAALCEAGAGCTVAFATLR
jgi:hypothetical protein